jgi:hypothetical protein
MKFSAQSAVLLMSDLGGVGVCQVKITLLNHAPSAFLKIAQTFCIERIESRTIIFCILLLN